MTRPLFTRRVIRIDQVQRPPRYLPIETTDRVADRATSRLAMICGLAAVIWFVAQFLRCVRI